MYKQNDSHVSLLISPFCHFILLYISKVSCSMTKSYLSIPGHSSLRNIYASLYLTSACVSASITKVLMLDLAVENKLMSWLRSCLR